MDTSFQFSVQKYIASTSRFSGKLYSQLCSHKQYHYNANKHEQELYLTKNTLKYYTGLVFLFSKKISSKNSNCAGKMTLSTVAVYEK